MTSRGFDPGARPGGDPGTDGAGDRPEDPDGDVVGPEAPPPDEAGEGVEESGPPPMPLDAVFELLKNERRRVVLRYLMENPGRAELGELAEHVAVQENDISRAEMTSTERKRAYVGLYQCHLPKMDELGAVTFNRDRGWVELGPNVDQLEPYFGGPDEPDPWPTYYAGLAAANAVLFLGSLALDLAVGAAVAGVAPVLAGGLAVTSFAGLALFHLRRRDEADGGPELFD